MELFEEFDGFEWDEGNLNKNWTRHQVLNIEAEQVFFNEPLLVSEDEKHSTGVEKRFRALGKTENGRRLFIAFVKRKNLIRIISVRDMSRKEKNIYEEA